MSDKVCNLLRCKRLYDIVRAPLSPLYRFLGKWKFGENLSLAFPFLGLVPHHYNQGNPGFTSDYENNLYVKAILITECS